MHALYHLIYQSHAKEPFNLPQLIALLTQSHKHNSNKNITGLLLYLPSGQILQLLEGEESVVKNLYYEHIALDPRHTACTVLNEGPWARRSFPGWCASFPLEYPGQECTLPGYVEPSKLRAMMSSLAPNRPGLVHLIMDFIAQYDDSF